MAKTEYLQSIEKSLEDIIKDNLFNNYKNQIFVRHLGADFDPTYKEDYLWTRALHLSTNGCVLLLEKYNEDLAIKALKASAEIYEYLGDEKVKTSYDKEYCLILSSFCYDIAGYQANAQCLLRGKTSYGSFTNDEIANMSSDDYIISQIRLILLKKIPLAKKYINNDFNDPGVKMFNSAISKFYDHILMGIENNFIKEIDSVYQYYLKDANVHISHLLFLLKTRMNLYLERSVWNNLGKADGIRGNEIWDKYIKLLANDWYDSKVKNIKDRNSIFEFWVSQLRAIEKGLLDNNESYVIQMPTSAGKTFIAELAILDSLVKDPDKKCVYIAPFRALTNDKEIELSKNLSRLGYSVSALSGSYEIDELQEILLKETDVLIATPEKVDLLFRLNSDFFKDVSLLVVDEGHIIGNIDERSALLEFIIIKLKIKNNSLRVIFISAVMPDVNAEQFSMWFNDGKKGNIIKSLLFKNSDLVWEPTRKLIGQFTWEGKSGRIQYMNINVEDKKTKIEKPAWVKGIIKYKKIGKKDFYTPSGLKAETAARLAYELSKSGGCLVYCSQVRYTKLVGDAFLKLFKLSEDAGNPILSHFIINSNSESYFYALKWYGFDSYIAQCIRRGIGVHFGDMPEALRASVEKDYRLGNFKVLISTNTVAQGVNFPIKNLIIHSTIIAADEEGINEKLSFKDFWNIVGRVGRARKETEGQVIFLVMSKTDEWLFKEYTDKKNMENASSRIYLVLKDLSEKRINRKKFSEVIRILLEPHLLNLFIEEAAGTEDGNIIGKIMDRSLFKIQILLDNLDIKPLKAEFRNIIANIKSEEQDKKLIRVFGKTGFSFKSNKAISIFINDNIGSLKSMVSSDDYLSMLQKILELFEKKEIKEIVDNKLERLNIKPARYMNLIKGWIAGDGISVLQNEWNKLSGNKEGLNLFISRALYYRYVWGITSFLTVLSYKLGIGYDEFPENIKNLSAYVKYGMNNSKACLAKNLGIKNRDIAILLSARSADLKIEDFMRWISNFDREDLAKWKINQYDKQNILDVALKLNPDKLVRESIKPFKFHVKGIPYSSKRMSLSLRIKRNNILEYRRELNNKHDPYAIKLFHKNIELGYIPREYSKFLSTEIDLNGRRYVVRVMNTINRNTYNEVHVEMLKSR